MTSTDANPARAPIPARTWKIAAVVGAGAFMALLDSTVANLALESIRADFASDLATIQWVASGYLIALALSLPATGWLGRRFGYGRVWAASLAGFVAASILCAVAGGPQTLIAARLLQGLAAGIMAPAGQAVVAALAGPRQLGRLFGVLGFAIALGPALGPGVGGLVIEAYGWRLLFWANVPVGIAALVAAWRMVPGGERQAPRRFDMAGFLLLAAGLPLLLFGATEIGAEAPGPLAFACVGLGALLASLFVAVSARALHPLLDLALVRRPGFAAALATNATTGANMFGGMLLLPLYLQLGQGRDTAQTGLFLLVMGMGAAFALYFGGGVTDRRGPGGVAFSGALLLLLSTAPFLFPAAPGTVLVVAVLAARGVGMALAQMPAMTAAYSFVTPEEMGDATTLVNIVQRMSGAVGALGLAILAERAGAAGQGHPAYFAPFAVLGVLSVLNIACAAWLWRCSRIHA